MLVSSEFVASPTQKAFLEFVVNQTIEGNAHEIKGYTIAVQVLGRGTDFNQNNNPIVSIQASRLRKALEKYYEKSGKNDPIHIEIPKGAYVPVFKHLNLNSTKMNCAKSQVTHSYEEGWPIIEIHPFSNLTGDENKNVLALTFMSELAIEIGQSREFKTILMNQDNSPGIHKPARFSLKGSIYEDESGISVTVHINDYNSGEQVFGNSYKSNVNAVKFLSYQKELASILAMNIVGENGLITNMLMKETENKPIEDLSPYESLLIFYAFNQQTTIENGNNALEALHYSTQKYPNNALTWSFLARLYTILYAQGVPGFKDVLDQAIGYAENGVRLAPHNQRTLLILAWVYFQKNNIISSQNYLERAQSACQDSLSYTDILGYLFTLTGEWERGEILIRKAIRLNPYYDSIVHYTLWLDCIRKHNYEQAYLETTGIIKTANFWYPLTIASTLGLLGRTQEGAEYAKKLLELQPDFPVCGRSLIQNYIKFEEIRSSVIQGLNNVGLYLK